MWVCGELIKGSLQYAEFFLDLNVTADRLEDYTPGPDRQLWHHKRYMQGECKALLQLPAGMHVLSVGTSAEKPEHESGITHLISWS